MTDVSDEIAMILRKHFPGVGDFTIRSTAKELTELRRRRADPGREAGLEDGILPGSPARPYRQGALSRSSNLCP